MGEGRHPDVPGGQIRSYGWIERILRPDGSVGRGTIIPLPAWYIDGADRRILVDTGTGPVADVIEVLGRYGWNLAVTAEPEDDIRVRLERLGVAPEEIDLVVHTHLHFDHVRGNELFTNATFLVNAAELPWALAPPPFGLYYYREFSSHVRNVLDRVQLVHADHHVAPGVRLVHTGGHSPGHSVVFVETAAGMVVLGGDLLYNYRNLEYEWPPGPVFDVAATLRAIQTLKTADVIVLNHDPLLEELFPDGVVGGPLPQQTADYMRRLRTGGPFALGDYEPEAPLGALLRLPT
jgi:glyoxylase-like metal-dependent hydrolase (beta-lactamase superfamily II)